MKKHRMVVVSDLHCGDVLGLTPPEYQQSRYPFQAQLWNFYKQQMDEIGPVDDLVVNGDAVHGPIRKEAAGHSQPDVEDQIEMAVQALSAVQAKRIHVVRGTGFHTDGDLKFEDAIARALSVEADDECRLKVFKTLYHFRHVVGRSDTPYGQHTQLQKEVINELLQAELEEYPSAHVLIRSHVHYCAGTWLYDAKLGSKRQAFTTPALSLRSPKTTAFVRKLRTWLYHVGVTLVETYENGEVIISPRMLPIKVYGQKEYRCVA
jgi:hypothetical protein